MERKRRRYDTPATAVMEVGTNRILCGSTDYFGYVPRQDAADGDRKA